MDSVPPDTLIHRYVDISCPSGAHQRSLVTFRNHSVAAMFCIPCGVAWAEPTSRKELQFLGVDRTA
jgi:hypothetical protein